MGKRLTLVMLGTLAALLSAQALAANERTQTWQIKFKKFIYLWINTEKIVFDFSSSNNSTTDDGVLKDKTVGTATYHVASVENLGYCAGINSDFANYNPSGDFDGDPDGQGTVNNNNCYFAPSSVIDSATPVYSAGYDPNGDGNYAADADTDLLVAALGIGNFQVTTISTTDSIPKGLTLQFYPAAVEGSGLVTKSGVSTPSATELTNTSTSANANWTGTNYGYYVVGKYFLYLLPVSHGLVLDPSALDLSAFSGDGTDTSPYTKDITITYTVGAL